VIRQLLVIAHRWVGLTIAAFLFVSGLTGAVISWDHELDETLNAHLTHVDSHGAFIPSLELAAAIESRDPRAYVTFVPLSANPGDALVFGVDSRIDPSTGERYHIGYNEVFVDPVTGEELGRRDWGAPWPVTRENFVSFLYVLHYSWHIPEIRNIDEWGFWLLGTVALLWCLDCFVGFFLTLPPRRRSTPALDERRHGSAVRSWWNRWSHAWKVRWRAGPTRLSFDLHRAFSLWTWAMLFIIAFTGFSLNLYTEIFYPLMSKVSSVTDSPFDRREAVDEDDPIMPRVSYEQLVASAAAEGAARGWPEPPGSAFYSSEYGIHNVEFFYPGEDHGTDGVSPKTLYFDGVDGNLLGDSQPWEGTAADVFVQAQFPLHSGRILGLPGRILVSVMGLVIAMLSVTGVIIWARKRASRRLSETRASERRAPVREIRRKAAGQGAVSSGSLRSS
jgi:uncharacterized iron-regulated membrane protein